MIDILNNQSSYTNLLAKGDVFILDHGFRDCISDIEDHEFETQMPALLGKFEKKLSTQEANHKIGSKPMFAAPNRLFAK